ncbi:ribosome silencing factor [bacterium]|nr:ribosome silencing factor [bacterium]
MTKNEKLETILRTLSDKKGVNIMAFDVEKKSGYTDVIVFVTGTSTQHNTTMADSLLRELKNAGFAKPLIEGETSAKWILVDAGSVIVNIMLEELRDYYSLEDIWNGCSKIDVTPYIQ